ncbi:MAG TPA: M55 family metallopeptidase [Selenomonadales bacterium]|nr:M55 family metallopeptidase [Selenomonadales bacterium]
MFFSVDMEGISGIVSWDQTSSRGYDYARARKLMTEEVNAAVRGAVRAGAKELLVNDSHNAMTNLLIEELQSPARLLTGSPKPGSMMEGLDATFDGVMLLGYHARMNARGVLSHTYSSRTVGCLWLNGQEAGELALNAYVAGHYDVPVLMVSGDNQLVGEAKALIADVTEVTVKETRSRYAAICLGAEDARRVIEEGAYRALIMKQRVRPVKIKRPVQLEVAFLHSGMAEAAEIMPGAIRTGGTSVAFQAPDILAAYKAFRTLVTLAGTVQ